jgi:hypothetical protein
MLVNKNQLPHHQKIKKNKKNIKMDETQEKVVIDSLEKAFFTKSQMKRIKIRFRDKKS